MTKQYSKKLAKEVIEASKQFDLLITEIDTLYVDEDGSEISPEVMLEAGKIFDAAYNANRRLRIMLCKQEKL